VTSNDLPCWIFVFGYGLSGHSFALPVFKTEMLASDRRFPINTFECCLGEEQEKHVISVPTILSMAKGLLHGPIEIKKINKPIIFLEVMLTSAYSTPQPEPKPAG